MDRSAFTPSSPGRLVTIPQESAFVPAPLPPAGLVMDDELWGALVEARGELMLVEGMGRRLVNPGLFVRALQRREAVRSSTIEHIDATAEELLLFEVESAGSVAEHPADGLREVLNYERALRHGVELLSELPLSLRFIRELHRLLLVGVRGHDKTPGEFRRVQVSIGHRFYPPPPGELAGVLADFEGYLHAPGGVDPLIRAFVAHYQFEAIHPFRDGNGRVGRLLLAISLMSWCGLSRPWLFMSAYFERHREQYMSLLYRVSTSGVWREWVLFCLHGVAETSRDTAQRMMRLLDLRAAYAAELGSLNARARLMQILDDLFASPVVTIPMVQQSRQVDYKTAKSDIARLVNAGILREVERGRPRMFIAPGIVAAAHEDA